MSKIKKFLTALLITVFIIATYLFYSIRIYDSPYTVFTTSHSLSFQAFNQHCYQSTDNIPEMQQKTLRLLVWNLHKGKDKGWRTDLDKFAQHADLLLLQEVTDTQQLAKHFEHRFSTALYVAAFDYLGERSGVAILANAAPDLYCAAMEQEPWIIIPKVANVMRFPLKNQGSLLVINLHLVNFELNPSNYRRQIETMMDLVSAHQGPIILAGDFNTWSQARLQLVSELAQQAGLKEVDYVRDDRLRFLGNPLDHVFVRGVKTLRATTQSISSSDHNPLLLELELEN